MTVAVIFVAPASVIQTAEVWARSGLVGDSLWVSADDLTRIDPDAPNAITATYLRFEHEPFVGPLAAQLAELGSLDEARVTWLRSTEDANGDLLAALDALARELLPYDQVHWLDIVVPQRRTDETAAPLAGQWTQFRIHPSDRPAPDVTDAGWDLGLAVPLHVGLALTGILGGVTTTLPWARLSAAENWVVRVFSRLVDGGLEARRLARQFVLTTLPNTHAAEQHPADYLSVSAGEADQITEAATSWLLSTEEGALSYRALEPSEFQAQPRLSVGQHLLNFRRFIPFGLQSMIGLHREPNAVVGNVLEFEDLGYNVGRRVEVVPWTDGIPDFAAMEASASSEALAALHRVRTREGAQPSAEVWEPLAQITTALVDCGPADLAGWVAPTKFGQRVSIAPSWIALGPPQTVASATPELALAENLAVATEAYSAVLTARNPSLRVTADPTGVTATAMRLSSTGNEWDNATLVSQLDGLDVPPLSPGHPHSLLERLRGRVIGGVLRSRLDAERWSDAATHSPDGFAPAWRPLGRRYRVIWWIALAVCLLLGVGWYIFHDSIDSALGTTIGLSVGLALVCVLTLVVALGMLYFFFRSWSSFLEKGRRRLELMALWLSRAERAWISHAELLNTERTSRAWADLLTRLMAPADSSQVGGTDVQIEKAPFSMRVGHPRFRADQVDAWLAEAGAQPGWRIECLSRIVGEFLQCPANRALQLLAKDQALPGGKLDQLAKRLEDLSEHWRNEEARQIWTALRDQIAVSADRLEVSRSQGLPALSTRLQDFFAELVPNDGERPWDNEQLVHAVTSAPDPDGMPVVVLSAAFSSAQLRVQVQALVNLSLLEPVEDSDTEQDPDLPR